MVLLLLIVVAPDNTRVDRGDPAIAVLSIVAASRLTPPRSGLERSDFVLRRIADVADRGLERLSWAESGPLCT